MKIEKQEYLFLFYYKMPKTKKCMKNLKKIYKKQGSGFEFKRKPLPNQITTDLQHRVLELHGNALFKNCIPIAGYRLLEYYFYKRYGHRMIVSRDFIFQLYSKISKYDPKTKRVLRHGKYTIRKTSKGFVKSPDTRFDTFDNPTDNGTYLECLISYWIKTGLRVDRQDQEFMASQYFEALEGKSDVVITRLEKQTLDFFEYSRIFGAVRLYDRHEREQIRPDILKRAILQCGGIIVSIDSYDSFFEACKKEARRKTDNFSENVWDGPKPNESAGNFAHAVCCVEYTEEYFRLLTWGTTINITPQAFSRVINRVFCVLSPMWIEMFGVEVTDENVEEFKIMMNNLRPPNTFTTEYPDFAKACA